MDSRTRRRSVEWREERAHVFGRLLVVEVVDVALDHVVQVLVEVEFVEGDVVAEGGDALSEKLDEDVSRWRPIPKPYSCSHARCSSRPRVGCGAWAEVLWGPSS